MNLAHNPTKDELANLLANCDDKATSHVLWVENSGEVHIDALEGETPVGLVKREREFYKFKCESFGCDKGYTGVEAAKDSDWVDSLYKQIVTAWQSGTTGSLV